MPLATTCRETPGTNRLMGRYLPVRELGVGGQATVHLAIDRSSGRKVVVKVPRSGSARSRLRFQREARTLARITHPNVIRLLDSNVEDDPWFMVYPFVEGSSLSSLILERGRFPWREAARLVAGLARGLQTLHSLGVLHRDIKPANVIVTSDDTPILIDLGLCLGPGDERLSVVGSLVGTAQYAAPEQLSCQRVDARSDLYSLGVVLWELLDGVNPFKGRSTEESVQRQLSLGPDELPPLPPGTPRQLVEVVHGLVQKRIDDRPASAGEVADDLAGIVDDLKGARARSIPFRGGLRPSRVTPRITPRGTTGIDRARQGRTPAPSSTSWLAVAGSFITPLSVGLGAAVLLLVVAGLASHGTHVARTATDPAPVPWASLTQNAAAPRPIEGDDLTFELGTDGLVTAVRITCRAPARACLENPDRAGQVSWTDGSGSAHRFVVPWKAPGRQFRVRTSGTAGESVSRDYPIDLGSALRGACASIGPATALARSIDSLIKTAYGCTREEARLFLAQRLRCHRAVRALTQVAPYLKGLPSRLGDLPSSIAPALLILADAAAELSKVDLFCHHFSIASPLPALAITPVLGLVRGSTPRPGGATIPVMRDTDSVVVRDALSGPSVWGVVEKTVRLEWPGARGGKALELELDLHRVQMSNSFVRVRIEGTPSDSLRLEQNLILPLETTTPEETAQARARIHPLFGRCRQLTVHFSVGMLPVGTPSGRARIDGMAIHVVS